jgi:ketosteroid isomerase-like protein
MRIAKNSLLAALFCLSVACSPRDFLTRRLAADLISSSDAFKAPQTFWLVTGVVSNKDFSSPDAMVLQRRGWILGTEEKCLAGIEPAPCWDVQLTPLGVDAIRPLISSAPNNGPIGIQVARRELIAVTGITKAGNFADVEFLWHWVSINQVGAALYDSGVRYRSTVVFRGYDDGWRVVEQNVPRDQTLEEALHNAQPTN